MISIDFDQLATVLVLPKYPREELVRTVAQRRTLRDAIRLVVEELPSGDRPRALIRTTDRSLFSAEIEAIYAHCMFENGFDLRNCA